MTSGKTIDEKEVVFVNEAARDAYLNLPDEVRETADARTSALQNNLRLPSGQVTYLKGDLAGIAEIRRSFDTNTYRVYHAVEYREVIMVLDAGMKKSSTGDEIPKPQLELLKKRKARADEIYSARKTEFKRRYDERQRSREACGKPNAPTASGYGS